VGDYPNYPPGKSTKRKLHGGPWDGESIGFREDQREMHLFYAFGQAFTSPVIPDQYLGRYVVRKIQQKNRVITRVEWETAEQKQALIRERLRLPGIRIY
jgi:hypothetical protein